MPSHTSRESEPPAIRPFQPLDAEACLNVIRSALLQDKSIPSPALKELLRKETVDSIRQRASLFYLAVCLADNEIAGVAGIDFNEVRLLYVAPHEQRKGFGTALLGHLEAMVPREFFADVFAYCSEASQGFYRRLGYADRGEHRFEVGGETLRTRFMVKRLTIDG